MDAHEILERKKILVKINKKAEKVNIQTETEVLMSPQTISSAATIVNYAGKCRSYRYWYGYHKNAAW
jgi:hypothetical protein